MCVRNQAGAPAVQQQQQQQQSSSGHVPSRLSRTHVEAAQPREAGTASAGPGSARSEAGSAASQRQGDLGGGLRWPESAEGLPPVPDTMTSSAEGTLQCTVREALELLFFEGVGPMVCSQCLQSSSWAMQHAHKANQADRS